MDPRRGRDHAANAIDLFFLSTRLYVYDRLGPIEPASASIGSTPEETAAVGKEIKNLESKAKRAQRSVAGMVPGSVYIVVDTAQNKLYLKKRDKVLHEALCSTAAAGSSRTRAPTANGSSRRRGETSA
jgi:hypothetical protein